MGNNTHLPKGVLDRRVLPDSTFQALWDAIIAPEELKNRVLAQALLNFTLRPRVARASFPLHGLILLTGKPGTGKTSLARGLASRVAGSLKSSTPFYYLEVEPHGLADSGLGKSQRAVTELLGSTVREQAGSNPTIVLLDEVETLAGSRSRMSLEANPIDVHRATDAVLAQLDNLAAEVPSLLFIATSNFPDAIDDAFLSRCDLIETVGLPERPAVEAILKDTLQALAKVAPKVEGLTSNPQFSELVEVAVGLDGRQLRKLVISACASSKETALDANRLTLDALIQAARASRQEKGGRP